MSLPIFAPYPPAAIRASFSSEEWRECLQAWTVLIDAYLEADDKTFRTATEVSSFALFLRSYYEQWSQTNQKPGTGQTPEGDALRSRCFHLVNRYLRRQQELLGDLLFLSHFCRAHLKSPELTPLLEHVWSSSQMQKSVQKWKTSTIQDLEHGNNGQTRPSLGAITPLVYSSRDMATFIMTGSDFLEAAMSCYTSDERPAARQTFVVIVYLGLTSLVRDHHMNSAVLSDHLYSLKAQAETHKHTASLLADLVTNTPLLKTVQRSPASDTERVKKLLEILHVYNTPSIARRKKRSKHQEKGKRRALSHPSEMHMHRMSLVTQIQDLFPELGSGFILRLLDEYHDNVEEVTAHLLDGELPDHLAQLDRGEQAPLYDGHESEAIERLAPRSTPPIPETFIPHRANVYDNDDFDRLEIDTSRLHIGKKPDAIEDSDSANKAAILAALAAFDSDDDERDDTYDIEDVGGTVDTAHHDGDDTAIALPTDENDATLYRLYQTTPEAFSRAAETRRSAGRASLKRQTGMTDEAIEGWAIMLQRDPKRANRMSMEAARFDGSQSEIARTAYRGQATDTEDSDAGTDRGMYHNRGRGRGGGHARGRGRGRGGSVAGSSNDAATAAAQRRKEANKSSRANHNRRDQRARKMARGGFPAAA